MARMAGAGLVFGSGLVIATYVLLPRAVGLVIRLLTLVVNGCVWLAAATSAGVDPWTIAAGLARAGADALTAPAASIGLLALAALGAVAFYGLQRLLGTDDRRTD